MNEKDIELVENSPKDLVRQDAMIEVINLMFLGSTKKDACEQTGIDIKVFDRAVASYPELLQEMGRLIRARLANVLEDITEQRVMNAKALTGFMEDLREILEDDEEDWNERVKAFAALIKADKHFAGIMKNLLPANIEFEEKEPEPGVDITKKVQGNVIGNLKGAKLREVTITAKMQDDEQDFIEGDFSD